MGFKLLGVGSPLVDYSLEISDAELKKIVPDGKGCTRRLSRQERSLIFGSGKNLIFTPGGSAANTVRALARLGGQSALFGKIGDDADGEFFCQQLRIAGADDSLIAVSEKIATGCCLSLITPDAERTMLSDLGASLDISENDLQKIPFGEFSCLLLEGYLSCEKWSVPLLKMAKASALPAALDLNNYELVKNNREYFLSLTNSYIDILFANEQEISALLGTDDPYMIMDQVNSAMVVLKRGKNGSVLILKKDRKIIEIESIKTGRVKDTTGAGDFYAAGFFYGMSRNWQLADCCRAGSACASAIISRTGTLLSEEEWDQLHKFVNEVNK